MAGGGVRGKVAGIALSTTTQVGRTMEEPQVFIDRYRQAGGIITAIVVGMDINGTISEFLSASFNGTGEPGKRTSIGNGKIPGECNARNIGRNLKVSNRIAHSNNTERHHNTLTLVMEDLIKLAEMVGIEDRTAEGPYLLEMASVKIGKSSGQNAPESKLANKPAGVVDDGRASRTG